MIRSFTVACIWTLGAGAALAVNDPFAAYRSACLETAADIEKVRAYAGSQGWTALSPEQKDAIAPGNPDGIEGWSLGKGGMIVSISTRTIRGGLSGAREGGIERSCTLSAQKGDDGRFIEAYSKHLARKPSEDTNEAGQRTAVWNVTNAEDMRLHYYFGNTAAPSSSIYSVSILKK